MPRGARNIPASCQRLLSASRRELDSGRLRLFADAGVPLYQHLRGHQRVAPWQARVTVGCSF